MLAKVVNHPVATIQIKEIRCVGANVFRKVFVLKFDNLSFRRIRHCHPIRLSYDSSGCFGLDVWLIKAWKHCPAVEDQL
jgi:predicted metal-binding transcription factor (methanogenesis marker protein 9)